MTSKVIFLSCLIFTLWTLEFFAPYAQISDDEQGDLSELPDGHTLGIGMFGPYEQISDGEQGHLSELPDGHTLGIGIFGPYAQIYDEELGYIS
jgi:hypothetical protein